MKKLWLVYAAKLDALSLRERLMVFGAVLVLVIVVLGMLLVEPPTQRKNAVMNRMTQQQNEVRALQAQVQQLERQRFDPDAANRTRRDALQRQIAQIDSDLTNLQKGLVPANEMKGLLQDVLARNPRVQLVSLHTLAASPLIEKPAPAPIKGESAARAPEKSPAPGSNVFKHGVQITLRGAYPDLHDYIARLEGEHWHMFWARASMNAAYPNVTITLTIFTLSLDKAWLVV